MAGGSQRQRSRSVDGQLLGLGLRTGRTPWRRRTAAQAVAQEAERAPITRDRRAPQRRPAAPPATARLPAVHPAKPVGGPAPGWAEAPRTQVMSPPRLGSHVGFGGLRPRHHRRPSVSGRRGTQGHRDRVEREERGQRQAPGQRGELLSLADGGVHLLGAQAPSPLPRPRFPVPWHFPGAGYGQNGMADLAPCPRRGLRVEKRSRRGRFIGSNVTGWTPAQCHARPPRRTSRGHRRGADRERTRHAGAAQGQGQRPRWSRWPQPGLRPRAQV